MNAKEAANQLRPSFHLESMPPEDRHHVKFVEDVAAELGIEPTPFNLHQVADALDRADIRGDSLEYPKMLYSRSHHVEGTVTASFYDARHDWVWAHVANEDEAKRLGAGWVEDPAQLPPRGDIPLHLALETVANVIGPEDQPYHPYGPDGAKLGAELRVRLPGDYVAPDSSEVPAVGAGLAGAPAPEEVNDKAAEALRADQVKQSLPAKELSSFEQRYDPAAGSLQNAAQQNALEPARIGQTTLEPEEQTQGSSVS